MRFGAADSSRFAYAAALTNPGSGALLDAAALAVARAFARMMSLPQEMTTAVFNDTTGRLVLQREPACLREGVAGLWIDL